MTGRYLPAETVGTVIHANGKRVAVRYPWGVQLIAVENLRVVERAKKEAA